ncbi:MAG TPA: PIG-L family deacetylase [Bryobacteraceae bacterium]|nr:PIG-L family deacetylase [Bryobacteraceae bacterium]
MTCARAVARALLLLTAAIPGARGQLPEAGSTMAQSALDRLAHRGRALLIAAHPDDENTALLAWLARGRHVDTAYLSLTRGEGGQNLIGPEQGSLLGLIRTEELLAARRMDGAAQMFTRAVDFGYSKRPEEAFTKWGREQVLGDVVLAIRRFRPDVIILRFSGTPRDGHGHHQASAILGREAFEAAADASRFPEQLTSVKPWRARRLVSNALSFTPEQEKEAAALPGRVELDLGAYSPMLGYSWSEIAAISRSQHRSQGMGTPRHRGAQKNYFVHLAGEPFERDLFEGVELTSRVGEFRRAAQEFDHRDPARVVPLLLAGRPRAEDKVAVDEAIALCTGLHLRATADRPYAAWGSSVRIGVEAVNRSTVPLMLEEVKAGPAGALKPAAELRDNVPLAYQLQWRSSEPVHISSDHLAALPDPALKVRFLIRAQDQVLELERPVVHLYVDKIQGELSRPFLPGPPV